MKNSITIISIAIIIICFAWTITYAEDYTVLAPLPGIGADGTGVGNGEKTKLEDYLPAVFKLSIGIAAAMAFVMITFGGIMYATSDAITGKSQGREYIENALWGLLLVIGAWVILNTINPKILKFDLSLPRPKIATSPPGVVAENITSAGSPYRRDSTGVLLGYKMTNEQIADDAVKRSQLGSVGINRTSPCKNGETLGCTNLNGLSSQVIPDLKNLVVKCECIVTITGGTEGGHKEHGPGLSVVDLDENPKLRKFIEDNSKGQTGNTRIVRWNTGAGSATAGFRYEAAGEGRSTGSHWHVVIK